MRNQRILIRNIEVDQLLECFFISAIVSVLGIRFFLHLTNYPLLGAGTIHLAHMLWGGLLMLVAIVMLIAFLDKQSATFAAVIGGFGFGAFIDELGKFITQNNNYFFQPAIAIIYIIFVVMYLSFEALKRQNNLTKEECLVNALELTKETIHNEMEHLKKKKALQLLEHCDPKDPVVKSIRAIIKRINAFPPPKPNALSLPRQITRRYYHALTRKTWFIGAVIAFFVGNSLASLLQATHLIGGVQEALLVLTITALASLAFMQSHSPRQFIQRSSYTALFITGSLIGINMVAGLTFPSLPPIGWVELLSSTASGLLVAFGVFQLRKSRLSAYRLFKKAVMISIFLTQVFAFYKEQLAALLGLAGNIVILAALNYAISQEQEAQSE